MGNNPDNSSDDIVRVPWRSALLGLGGNIGDVLQNMRLALAMLQEDKNVEIVRCSSLYETPPWGKEDQPLFLNVCVEIYTCLEPEDLLKACHKAENVLKRERTEKWGPRTIDIDILMLEEGGYYSDDLEVPHPRILERAFVLVPMAEIADHWILENNTIGNWCYNCNDEGISIVADSGVFDEVMQSPAVRQG